MAVSSVLRYAMPHFNRLFYPSQLAPDEHDTQFLRSYLAMYTSHGRTYARVGVRDPTRMYARGRIYSLAP